MSDGIGGFGATNSLKAHYESRLRTPGGPEASPRERGPLCACFPGANLI